MSWFLEWYANLKNIIGLARIPILNGPSKIGEDPLLGSLYPHAQVGVHMYVTCVLYDISMVWLK